MFPLFRFFFSSFLLRSRTASKCFDQLDAATTGLASSFLKCFGLEMSLTQNGSVDVNRSTVIACVFSCTKFSRSKRRSETTLFKNTDEKYASLDESLVSFIHLTCVPWTFDLLLSLK